MVFELKVAHLFIKTGLWEMHTVTTSFVALLCLKNVFGSHLRRKQKAEPRR